MKNDIFEKWKIKENDIFLDAIILAAQDRFRILL